MKVINAEAIKPQRSPPIRLIRACAKSFPLKLIIPVERLNRGTRSGAITIEPIITETLFESIPKVAMMLESVVIKKKAKLNLELFISF